MLPDNINFKQKSCSKYPPPKVGALVIFQKAMFSYYISEMVIALLIEGSIAANTIVILKSE